MKWTFTSHFIKQVKTKGFSPEAIINCLNDPDKITDVRRYPGQKRYCGSGVAVVVSGNSCITVYEDGVVTPMRADQMNDPEALNSRRLGRG